MRKPKRLPLYSLEMRVIRMPPRKNQKPEVMREVSFRRFIVKANAIEVFNHIDKLAGDDRAAKPWPEDTDEAWDRLRRDQLVKAGWKRNLDGTWSPPRYASLLIFPSLPSRIEGKRQGW